MAQQLSPLQRANLFQQATRQNIQNIGTKSVQGGQQDIDFEIPKARYLAKLLVKVKVKLNIKHASKTDVPVDFFTPERIIQRISLDLNNGFAPFLVDGSALKLINLVSSNADFYYNRSDILGANYLPTLKASVTGVDNDYHFVMELPLTLNERDPIGLVLLQNNASLVNLKLTIASPSNILNDSSYTVDIKNVTANVHAETFSVPAHEQAHPDMTTLKLIQSATHIFSGAGKNEVNIGTGHMYRKLALQFFDADGNPFEDEDFLSNIDLVFNTSDCNYSIEPSVLRYINQKNYGVILPKGTFIFDFAYQGIPNMGGSRDLIDTESLTSFVLRFNSNKGGKVNVIKEGIARLA